MRLPKNAMTPVGPPIPRCELAYSLQNFKNQLKAHFFWWTISFYFPFILARVWTPLTQHVSGVLNCIRNIVDSPGGNPENGQVDGCAGSTNIVILRLICECLWLWTPRNRLLAHSEIRSPGSAANMLKVWL